MGRFPRKISTIAGRKQPKRDKTRRRMKKEAYKLYMEYIAKIHSTIDQAIVDGARQFNRPLGEVRSHVHSRTRVVNIKERLHHAYLHVKAKELNEGKRVGQRLRLAEIQNIVRNEVPHYTQRPKEEQMRWIRALALHKAEGETQRRRNSKAEVADHAHTIETISREMQGAEMRYGLKAFFMGVRSDATQNIAPTILCGDDVKECIALYMGRTPEQMVRMLEICILNGREGIVGSAKRMNANQLRSECRQFIQTLLNMALSNGGDSYDTVEMNYKSYETAIVARYGYRLTGWTWRDKVCNPGEITRIDDLRTLHAALVNKTCRWVAVDQTERDAIKAAAAAEPVTRRADFGVARGSYKEAAALRAAEEKEAAAKAAADKENGVAAPVAAEPPAKKKKQAKGKKASAPLTATNAPPPAAAAPASTPVPPPSSLAHTTPAAPQPSFNQVPVPVPTPVTYPSVSTPAVSTPPMFSPQRMNLPIPARSPLPIPPATHTSYPMQQPTQFLPPAPNHPHSHNGSFPPSSFPSPSPFQGPPSFHSSFTDSPSFPSTSFNAFSSFPSMSSSPGFPANYMPSPSSFPTGSNPPSYNYSSPPLPTPRPSSSHSNPTRPAF